MSQVRRSVLERVQRYGLRTICAGCGDESQRHFPRTGRLRDHRCAVCRGELRSLAWVNAPENAGRWAQLVSETAARRRPFAS